MNIRHLIKKSEKEARKGQDKEHAMVKEVLKLLDEHDPSVSEIMTVLINILCVVTLVAVEPEQREECLASFLNDVPDAIDHLADQLEVIFDWKEFRTLMEDYGS